LTVLGHSMGGHLGLRFVHDHAAWVRSAVLSAPMMDIVPPYGIDGVTRILAHGGAAFGLGGMYVPGAEDYGPWRSVFEGNRLTSDPRRFRHATRWIERDPRLAMGGPTVAWLDAAFRSIAVTEAVGYAEAIAVPVLIVQAGRELLVSNAAQVEMARRLAHGELVAIADSLHEILMERDAIQARFWTAFDRFIVTHR
jgi:lysophospholipase